jgi:urease accessory protein
MGMSASTSPLDSAKAVATPATDPPRWRARLELACERRGPRTVLVRKHQRGPLTVQRPFYPEGAPCHLYLLHPPGGVVGGDLLELEVTVEQDAHALLTTPGAGKFYRCEGRQAELHQDLRVASGATLEWLPQETLFFDAAWAHLSTRVDLAGGGRFLGWEIHCLGRPAIGERFTRGRADLGLALYRDGTPLLLERLRLTGRQSLDAPAGLRGRPLTATLWGTGADAQALERAREILARAEDLDAGATLLDDLLVVRCLGAQGEPVKALLTRLWSKLRPLLLQCAPCPPRIWST